MCIDSYTISVKANLIPTLLFLFLDVLKLSPIYVSEVGQEGVISCSP